MSLNTLSLVADQTLLLKLIIGLNGLLAFIYLYSKESSSIFFT